MPPEQLVTGLPAGVSGTWAADVVTISGTPTVSGLFTYTVTLTGGCGIITASGTINVSPVNTISITSPAGTDAQTVCINTPIINITYATTGATGAAITGLPAGISGSWTSDVVTISGTPSVPGPFTYTVTLTGGCGIVAMTGTINVNSDNTINRTSCCWHCCTNSLYKYSHKQYYLCNHWCHWSNRNRITGRSNRHLGCKCCNNKWYPDSIRIV